jgi:hypothetical protein
MAVLLVGCATKQVDPITTVDTVYVYPDCGSPPVRTQVDLKQITWKVIDGNFALSPEGYENLSYNVTMILAAIRELGLEIEYYEKCIERSN